MEITPEMVKAEGKNAGKSYRRSMNQHLKDSNVQIRMGMLVEICRGHFYVACKDRNIEENYDNYQAFFDGYLEGWNSESK